MTACGYPADTSAVTPLMASCAQYCLNGRDHAGLPGQLVDADGDQRTVVVDPVSADASGQNVDCPQLTAAGIPPNARTELGLLAGPETRATSLTGIRRPRTWLQARELTRELLPASELLAPPAARTPVHPGYGDR